MKTFLCSCPAVDGNAVEIRAADAGEAEATYRGMVKGLKGAVKVEAVTSGDQAASDQSGADQTNDSVPKKRSSAKRKPEKSARGSRSPAAGSEV